jgi:hypothetical protein
MKKKIQEYIHFRSHLLLFLCCVHNLSSLSPISAVIYYSIVQVRNCEIDSFELKPHDAFFAMSPKSIEMFELTDELPLCARLVPGVNDNGVGDNGNSSYPSDASSSVSSSMMSAV